MDNILFFKLNDLFWIYYFRLCSFRKLRNDIEMIRGGFFVNCIVWFKFKIFVIWIFIRLLLFCFGFIRCDVTDWFFIGLVLKCKLFEFKGIFKCCYRKLGLEGIKVIIEFRGLIL